MGKFSPLEALHRVDAVRVQIKNPQQVPVTLFARQDVPVEADGVEELLNFVSLQDTLSAIEEKQRAGAIAPFFGENGARLEEVVVTPDFHKGAGIPVGTVAKARGFVVPAAVGSDVCCGMRLLVTDASREEIAPKMVPLLARLRAIFFQGARDIPMSPVQREAMLREGLLGLYETAQQNASTGLWRYYHPDTQRDDLARVHFGGGLFAKGVFSFGDYIRASGASDSRDNQIGSVGGGNHFVELQSVDDLYDGATARVFGLSRNAVTIMAHSGSVGLGHMVGKHFVDQARALYPKGIGHPEHGFYVLPTEGPLAQEAAAYVDAMRNAANFAFANRLFLGLMMVRALSEVLGRQVESRLVYDAPHNLIWEHEGGEGHFLHRKGACPAPGAHGGAGPFGYTGEPVIIPGSMGDASYVLAGEGNPEALCSACHGAGRSLSRGAAQHVTEDAYQRALEPLRVVTPIDPDSPQVKGRRDILAKHHQRLREEAPYAYKAISAVVETVEEAKIARRVARLWPLLTVKG
jgi:tRNA-splicing ligase RtcB